MIDRIRVNIVIAENMRRVHLFDVILLFSQESLKKSEYYVNYHKHLKTPDHHISTELIEVSECATTVTQDGGALSFQKLVHTLKFEHKINTPKTCVSHKYM